MPRRRTALTTKIFQWCSARRSSKEHGYTQFGNSLFERDLEATPATPDARRKLLPNPFHDLSLQSRWVYMCLCVKAKGRTEVEFTKSDAAKCDIPATSFRRSIKELEERKFITVDHAGATRQPNIYKFCSDWKTY